MIQKATIEHMRGDQRVPVPGELRRGGPINVEMDTLPPKRVALLRTMAVAP